MHIQTFDQNEFGSGGASEFWLAIGSESKELRNGSVTDFFKLTEYYDCFSRWQAKKIDTAIEMSLIKATKDIVFELEYLIPFVKKYAGINLEPNQTVSLIYSEWCLLDIVWEDDNSMNRLVWCTTA